MEQEKEHKRRVRYKGTHPRSYREKYKELNPEKYQQDVEKIIQSGKTPAGMHIPICVNEILEFLNIQPGQIGLDATLGYGGHSRKMLEKLQGQGHLYATDVDPIESEKTRSRLEEAGYGPDILTIRRMNFAQLDEVAPGVQFDFVLADLGVSSMQIDNPERGFTFKQDGPLDLRLDPTSGEPASQRLRELNREEIAAMLVENADEPYAQEIAKAIFQKRRKFQALRIDVNSEFEVLEAFLQKLPDVLNPGGRAAVLTFHSGEDRLVKKSFQALARQGVYREVAKEVVRPSAQECFQNPRAKSTKMRWAIRAED